MTSGDRPPHGSFVLAGMFNLTFPTRMRVGRRRETLRPVSRGHTLRIMATSGKVTPGMVGNFVELYFGNIHTGNDVLHSLKEIGDLYQISPQAVRYHLLKRGVKLRPPPAHLAEARRARR